MGNGFRIRENRFNINNKINRNNLNRTRRKNIDLSLERITNNLVFLQHRR